MTKPLSAPLDNGVRRVTVFAGHRLLFAGSLAEAAVAVKQASSRASNWPLLVFDDATGRVVDVDSRGDDDEVRARYTPLSGSAPAPAEHEPSPRRRGRPTLGVVGREVTLLPRHWEWLNAQPGGPSVALRRLVDGARHATADSENTRMARDRAYHFLSAIAGDMQGYEDAIRALFGDDLARLRSLAGAWPPDVASYALRLANGN